MTTLPTSLVRFRGELESAIRREQRARSRRRVPRIAFVAAAATAVAVGALTVLPGDPGNRLVEPASAAQRAATALAATPGAIVHVEAVVEQRNADGSRTTWREESWQETAPPYDVRRIVTGANGERVESPTPAPASAEPFREQVLDLLRSGKLTESDRSTAGGRELISFAWDDGRARYEYTVAAGTYEPLRWRISPEGGETETTVTFETYEIVPAG